MSGSDFVREAQRFRSLVESAHEHGRRQFLLGMNEALPAVYAAALRLRNELRPVEPAAGGHEDEAALEEEVRVHHERWTRVSEALREVLGDADLYWEVFDPRDQDDPTAGELSDDLADIYLDLEAVAGRTPTDELLWEWWLTFETHWGVHATSALKAIHWRVHGEFVPDD